MLYLLCPLVILIKNRIVELMVLLSGIGGVMFQGIQYLRDGSVTMGMSAYLFRVFMAIGAFLLVRFLGVTELEGVFYRIFLDGMMMYFLLSWNPFYASRMSDALRFVIVALVVHRLVTLDSGKAGVFLIVIILYTGLLFCRTLDNRIRSGLNESVHVWNYPYATFYFAIIERG